jgi:hypothetical protein
MATEHRAGSRGLRNRLPRHERSVLAARDPVGNVTSFTVKGITKDNFLFGVRAIDRDGNESVVRFPVPK